MAGARTLRANSTEAEQILWAFLKNRKFHNLKFRRQHKIGKYVLDFYCAEKKLCIELDGAVHTKADQPQRDAARSSALQAKGITVIRFWNSEVKNDISTLLESIRTTVLPEKNLTSLPPPSPQRGEGGREGEA